MATECYAQVRGSAIRVTSLDNRGYLNNPMQTVVSKKVATVTINETTESGASEFLRNDRDEPRLNLRQSDKLINYLVDVDFLRVDPGMVHLMTGRPMVTNYSGDVVGFDAKTRLPVKSFALEVWSKLPGTTCVPSVEAVYGFGEGGFGEGPFGGGVVTTSGRRYGYTLFPFLKGGHISGFIFENGLVSFNLRGAQTRRQAKWGQGPHDVDVASGVPSRMATEVSGNSMWRNIIVAGSPPEETQGIVITLPDVIDGGTPSVVGTDIFDGGTPSTVGTTDHMYGGNPRSVL